MLDAAKIIKNTQDKKPIVHCITNYVTVNDVANVVLACGASPVMADEAREVASFCAICQSLVINTGTLNANSVAAMLAACKMANQIGNPVVLDPVGMGAAPYRNDTINLLLDQVKFSAIKGNASEIRTILEGTGTTKGVDADSSDEITKDSLPKFISMAKQLAQKTGAIVGITGAIDVVADDKRAYAIYNGHASMAKITGTGCMISGLVGGYLGANPGNYLEAAAVGVCVMGIAGQLAYARMVKEQAGNATMRNYIIDNICNMTAKTFEKEARIEVYE